MGLPHLLLVSLVVSEVFSHTLSSCTEETQVFQHPLHSQCATLPPMCIPTKTGNSEHCCVFVVQLKHTTVARTTSYISANIPLPFPPLHSFPFPSPPSSPLLSFSLVSSPLSSSLFLFPLPLPSSSLHLPPLPSSSLLSLPLPSSLFSHFKHEMEDTHHICCHQLQLRHPRDLHWRRRRSPLHALGHFVKDTSMVLQQPQGRHCLQHLLLNRVVLCCITLPGQRSEGGACRLTPVLRKYNKTCLQRSLYMAAFNSNCTHCTLVYTK